MSINLHLHPDFANLVFSGPIDQPTAIQMREIMRAVREYYQYDTITIEVNSPGGELIAMRALHSEMIDFRQHGGSVTTVGLMQVGSAAALLLAFGDVGKRWVQPYTELLFHHSRTLCSSEQVVSGASALRIAERLKHLDQIAVGDLVAHVLTGCGGATSLGELCLARMAALQSKPEANARWPQADDVTESDESVNRTVKRWQNKIMTSLETMRMKADAKYYADLLMELFDEDKLMPLDIAWALLLIDHVEGDAMTPSFRRPARRNNQGL